MLLIVVVWDMAAIARVAVTADAVEQWVRLEMYFNYDKQQVR